MEIITITTTNNVFLLLLTFVLSIPCFGILIFLFESLTRYLVSIVIFRSGCDLSWPNDFEFYGTDHHDFLEPFTSAASCSGHTKSLRCESLRIGQYRPRPEEQGVECVFCLCDVEEGEEIRELRCNHVFHRTCLDRWLDHRQSTCPLCRKSLVSADEKVDLIKDLFTVVNRVDTTCLQLSGRSS